ncbi:MAG: amidase, partial [Bacteroidota bacterium]
MRLLKLLFYGSLFSFLLSCKSTGKQLFSKKDVRNSQAVIGLDFEKSYLDTLYPYLLRNRIGYDSMRSHSLTHQRFPSLQFNPHPLGFEMPQEEGSSNFGALPYVEIPEDKEAIAFYTLPQLHSLIRSRKITSLELTQLYLKRLKEHDKTLFCVINLTEEL